MAPKNGSAAGSASRAAAVGPCCRSARAVPRTAARSRPRRPCARGTGRGRTGAGRAAGRSAGGSPHPGPGPAGSPRRAPCVRPRAGRSARRSTVPGSGRWPRSAPRHRRSASGRPWRRVGRGGRKRWRSGVSRHRSDLRYVRVAASRPGYGGRFCGIWGPCRKAPVRYKLRVARSAFTSGHFFCFPSCLPRPPSLPGRPPCFLHSSAGRPHTPCGETSLSQMGYGCLMTLDREQVLRSAAALLTRKSTATMDEVARAAGIGRATLHRHFAGRDALVRALENLGIQEFEAALDSARLDEDTSEEGCAASSQPSSPAPDCCPSSSTRTSSSRATRSTRAGAGPTPASPPSSVVARNGASSASTSPPPG